MHVITVEKKVLEKNDEVASRNRTDFKSEGLFTINVLGSPGSGKTTLLEQTILRSKELFKTEVIEGDIQTDLDAQRISALDIPVVQIVTNGACHLEAQLVIDSYMQLPDGDADLLIIENVGNLVCPAGYDLGEDKKIVVLSVTEGEDKPLKYPKMFRQSSVMIVNKIDLLPYVSCSIDKLVSNAKMINPDLIVFKLSCTTGEGFDEWIKWLDDQVESIEIPEFEDVSGSSR